MERMFHTSSLEIHDRRILGKNPTELICPNDDRTRLRPEKNSFFFSGLMSERLESVVVFNSMARNACPARRIFVIDAWYILFPGVRSTYCESGS